MEQWQKFCSSIHVAAAEHPHVDVQQLADRHGKKSPGVDVGATLSVPTLAVGTWATT